MQTNWQEDKEERKQYRRERYGEIARIENIGLNRNAVLETRSDGMVALVQETITPTEPGVFIAPQYKDILKTNPVGMLNLADFFNREDVIEALEKMVDEAQQKEEQAHGTQETHRV